MKLNITGLKNSAAKDIPPASDGTYAHVGARGGTELVAEKIRALVDPELLNQFNIIHSRVRDESIDKSRKNILVLHDTWDDPESEHLEKPELRKRFEKLVFVSNYQQATFNIGRGVPFAEGIVMQNAIDPIELQPDSKSKSDVVKLIYHTTPHRGLELLVPVFEKLCEIHDNIELDVFSSFDIYGWPQRNAPYQELFNRIRSHPKMTYHGYQPNEVIRDYLTRAHIYAYPNIWPETSCISVIEAMSAGVNVVTSNFGALPETCANFATMYGFDEDPNRHANIFANVLNMAIHEIKSDAVQNRLAFQKIFFDNYYNWQLRAAQWNALLRSLV